jgi:transposase
VSSISDPSLIYLGLDVHRDSISVGILEPHVEVPLVDKIFHDEASVRRLVNRFPDRGRLRVCYEAGPTGYELARLLLGMGVSCRVAAPSLIPTAPGDHVKTDKRDCRRIARLFRAGEVTFVGIPTPEQEAVRDVCRARGDVVADRQRARARLGSFLLRHGRVYRDGRAWTQRHAAWLTGQSFDHPALTATFSHYRAVADTLDTHLTSIDTELATWFDRDPFAEPVRRLGAYRGINHLGGLLLTAEVFDWRRFPAAPSFMSFVGLVPSEYSSGSSIRRGRLTRAGNTHVRRQLVESAWAYQHRPAVGVGLRRRQEGLPPEVLARAWKAQVRLCGRFQTLARRKNVKSVVAAAVARELAGFVWAEMTTDDTP